MTQYDKARLKMTVNVSVCSFLVWIWFRFAFVSRKNLLVVALGTWWYKTNIIKILWKKYKLNLIIAVYYYFPLFYNYLFLAVQLQQSDYTETLNPVGVHEGRAESTI